MMKLLAGAILALTAQQADAFYLPGVAPHNYEAGEAVELKVNKLSSTHTQLPFDYYSLKYCKPEEGVKSYAENLGEFLGGDRIENSPYVVRGSRSIYSSI
jgi:transmembrane 9 superfamily protein 2/4